MACLMGGSRRLVSCAKGLGMNLSRSGRVWVLDGGLGTELEKKGFDINVSSLALGKRSSQANSARAARTVEM